MRKYLCIVFIILVLCFTNIVWAENESTNTTDKNEEILLEQIFKVKNNSYKTR